MKQIILPSPIHEVGETEEPAALTEPLADDARLFEPQTHYFSPHSFSFLPPVLELSHQAIGS
jgi:hypothetical protein